LSLDEMDKRIIRLLQRNARVPNTELARTLDVTETTIRNRVNRLLEDGLIEIVAVVDPKVIDASISAFLTLTVAFGEVEEVARILHGRQEVRYLSLIIGRGQILTESFFRDHEHLLSFQNEFLATMPAVTHVETAIVVRVSKLSYEWEI
jgi:Lrp/AsnC family transcriptional regulator for asnA, asnC and gidA